MKHNSKIKLLFALLAFALTMQSCYTEVVLPKHTIKKTKVDKDRLVNFTCSVISVFDNDWLPDDGYYYQFRFDIKNLNEDKIDAFLNMLYSKGYNITGAWYRPATYDCNENEGIRTDAEPESSLSPVFIVLLSDFDDSIIEHNLYPLMTKPEIVCPYNVEEYIIQ
jgi:hypothetical protein